MLSLVSPLLIAAPKPMVPGTSAKPTATFTVSGGVSGTFTAELYLDKLPITASNFIDLARSGFYNGIHFHRVIPNFMAQFGCPKTKNPNARDAGTGGPPDGQFKNLSTGAMEQRTRGGNIQDENISKDSNVPGSLSMANTGRPNSGGSQLFLNVAHNSNLDWFSGGSSKHPVFGQIITGMDVVEKISKVKTRADNPVKPIKMDMIT